MVCQRYIGALNDTAAGIPAPAAFAAHLPECAPCRARLERLRALLAMADQQMATLAHAQPSAGFEARIRSAASARRPARGWPVGWFWPSFAAAAAAAVTLMLALPRERTQQLPVVGERVPELPNVRSQEPALMAAPAEDPPPLPETSRTLRREPEIIIPRGEAEALARLASLISKGLKVPQTNHAADQPPPALEDIRPIDIKPVEIVPLELAEVFGT